MHSLLMIDNTDCPALKGATFVRFDANNGDEATVAAADIDDVNRNFAIVTGPMHLAAASTADKRVPSPKSVVKLRCRLATGFAKAIAGRSRGDKASSASRYAAPSATQTNPGVSNSNTRRNFAKSLLCNA